MKIALGLCLLVAAFCLACRSSKVKGFALPWNHGGWGYGAMGDEILPTYLDNGSAEQKAQLWEADQKSHREP